MPRSTAWRTAAKTAIRLAAVVAVAVSAAATLGIRPDDAEHLAAFARAVRKWQQRPDFPQVGQEYIILSTAALDTRICGLRPAAIVMAVRRVPYLPEHLAANPGSAFHYQEFTRGAVSAYLRLCDEQGVADTVGMLEALAQKGEPTDADCRRMLESYQIYPPVCRDEGAVASVRRLISDTDARRPFTFRRSVAEALVPHIAALGRMPPDMKFEQWLASLTPGQQLDIYVSLDSFVRWRDPELWRAKRVNDFLCGVWAQTYGQDYNMLILPVLWVRRAGWVVLAAAAAWGLHRLYRRAVRKPTPPPAAR